MNASPDNWHNAAIKILLFLPILALISSLVAWLQYGIDLPFFDDWADYVANKVGSFEWQHLFKMYNDTLFPVARVLDAVAQRLLNKNSIAYQFLSMASVLGLLLFLQWRLLILALPNRLLAACAFTFTAFMLMPGSYWGLQNQAYIQALPLIFMLTAIYIILGKNWRTSSTILAVFTLGILSGFSYISGAFSALIVGIVFLLASCFIQLAERKPLIQGGYSLFIAGMITTVSQVWMIITIQKGMHIPNTALALPTESVFWMYLLGKVGRALMPVPIYPLFSFVLTIFAVLLVGIVFILFVRWMLQNKMRTLSEARIAIIYTALLGMIFVYLGIIAAARAHASPPEIQASWLDTFVFGFHRFHYFWVTLLWPWLVAGGIFSMIKFNFFPNKNAEKYLLFALLGVSIVFTSIIIRGNKSTYREYTNIFYSKHIRCLLSEIQKGQGINCPTLYPGDLSQPFLYARQINASFTRNFPILPVPINTNSPQPLFRLLNTVQSSAFSFKTKMTAQLKTCLILDVSARIHVDKTNTVQLSYATPSKSEKILASSLITSPQTLNETDLTDIVFQIESSTGFLDDFQLHTVDSQQPFDLKEIEIRCRLSPRKS
jgi:hypothetical protein